MREQPALTTWSGYRILEETVFSATGDAAFKRTLTIILILLIAGPVVLTTLVLLLYAILSVIAAD